MRVRAMGFYRIAVLSICMWSSQAQAVVFFDDSFDGSTTEAGGWRYAAGTCYWQTTTRIVPCPYLDLSTDVAHNGAKSLKGTYNAAWSDPNPQINEQAISRTIPVTTNIYTRYFYRTTGFTYTQVTGTKHIYYKSDSPYYPNFFSMNWWGSRELGFGGQNIAEICPTSGKGPYESCNFYPNMASRPLADNVWYCIEEHINLGTPNGNNGSLEIWVDGTQTLGYYNQNFLGGQVSGPNGNSSLTYFDFLQIYKQNGDGLMYYDQFAAGNSRIGCGGSTTTDQTPPNPPVGLVVR